MDRILAPGSSEKQPNKIIDTGGSVQNNVRVTRYSTKKFIWD